MAKLLIKIKPKKKFKLAVRTPAWSNNFRFSQPCEIINGYAYFDIESEAEISAEFEMNVRMIKCSNRVRANIGKIAVTRGPFVYCMEETDNGKNLQMLRINSRPDFRVEGDIIYARGFREKDCDILYSEWKKPDSEETEIRLIPYYMWGNRGENEMSVYINILY